MSDRLRPNKKNRLHFSLIFGLSLYFGLSDGLSERLIQKVKSPRAWIIIIITFKRSQTGSTIHISFSLLVTQNDNDDSYIEYCNHQVAGYTQ